MAKSPGPQSAIGNRQSAIESPVPRLLDGILLFFLALAVVLRPLLPGHRHEANLWVEMCVFIAALAWLVRAAMAQRLALPRTGMGLPAIALLLLAAVSTFRSSHPVESLATLLEWMAYGVAFAVLVAAVAREQGPGRGDFLRMLWASAFVVCLHGLFQQFVNLPLSQRMIAEHPWLVTAELRMNPQLLGDLMARATGRIYSTFLLSNSFAGFLALVVPGFIGHVLDRLRAGERGRWFLGLSGLWLAAALACLLLTFSKGGWLAFGAGLAAFAAMLGKRFLVEHARLLLGVVAAAAAAFALLVALGIVRVQLLHDLLTSGGVRLGYWQGALDMARDHPLGGVGLGTFGLHYPLYRPLLADWAKDTHNDYLQALAELGVPGFLVFLWLWAAWLRNVFRGSGVPRSCPTRPHSSPS
ncbi:MAG: O-antigen ligase family protein, partial [Planctomycetes bacterium]|nr:O-antigen ligase family protein [Planctomycetota bacterium]